MIDVIELTPDDVVWPFGSDPFVRIGKSHWPHTTRIDPFPCYSHDVGIVRRCVKSLNTFWHLPFDLTYYLMPFDTNHGTNGWFQIDTDHLEDKTKKHFGSVTLAGKRIPIHPAMTRYLCFHEFGHAVEEAIALSRGLSVGCDAIQPEYAEVRGLTPQKEYGGDNWHKNVCEVLACDFRILIAAAEPEFWPHPGIPRPEEVPAIKVWWANELVKNMEQSRLAKLDSTTED
jgi:hypothetical protein